MAEDTGRLRGVPEGWPLPGAAGLHARLVAAYASPARGYHDLRHVGEVLDRLQELAAAGEEFDDLPVRLAAWFHDAVHDGRDDDEERSARWAEAALPAEGVPRAVVAEVARLVRLTRAHDPAPGDRNGAALCDADLGVLAGGAQRYEEYVRAVRREYADVPEPSFRAGRARVLGDLLSHRHLFGTGHGRRVWEPAARANVRRELASLTGGGGVGFPGDAGK